MPSYRCYEYGCFGFSKGRTVITELVCQHWLGEQANAPLQNLSRTFTWINTGSGTRLCRLLAVVVANDILREVETLLAQISGRT